MKKLKSLYIRFINKNCKGVCVLCKYRKACMEEREAELQPERLSPQEMDYCRKDVETLYQSSSHLVSLGSVKADEKELTLEYTEELNRLHGIIEELTKEKDEYEAELHSIQIKLVLEKMRHRESLQDIEKITKKYNKAKERVVEIKEEYDDIKKYACNIGNCELRNW